MTRPTEFGAECHHGHLARSCQTCDLEEEIASLRSQLADLGKQVAQERARVGRLRNYAMAQQMCVDDSDIVVEAKAACDAHNDLEPTAKNNAAQPQKD